MQLLPGWALGPRPNRCLHAARSDHVRGFLAADMQNSVLCDDRATEPVPYSQHSDLRIDLQIRVDRRRCQTVGFQQERIVPRSEVRVTILGTKHPATENSGVDTRSDRPSGSGGTVGRCRRSGGWISSADRIRHVGLARCGVGEVLKSNSTRTLDQDIGRQQVSKPGTRTGIPFCPHARDIGSRPRETSQAKDRAAGYSHRRDRAVKISGVEDDACNPVGRELIVVSGKAPKATARRIKALGRTPIYRERQEKARCGGENRRRRPVGIGLLRADRSSSVDAGPGRDCCQGRFILRRFDGHVGRRCTDGAGRENGNGESKSLHQKTPCSAKSRQSPGKIRPPPWLLNVTLKPQVKRLRRGPTARCGACRRAAPCAAPLAPLEWR